MDDEYENEQYKIAIENGQNNLKNINLIRNWCANAKIDRHGGIGLIEQMTGLPIGHHGVSCPHAPSGGSFCWNLEESFLEFYSRNCKHCEKRQINGFPTIQPVIDLFEKQTLEKQEREKARAESEKLALTERMNNREKLLISGNSFTRQIVDLLNEIDEKNEKVAKEKLVELSKIAPETFNKEIINYLYSVAEKNDNNISITAIRCLIGIHEKTEDLLRLAFKYASSYGAHNEILDFASDNLKVADENDVSKMLHVFISLAKPNRTFPGSHQIEEPKYLIAAITTRPKAVDMFVKNAIARKDVPGFIAAAKIISAVGSGRIEFTNKFLKDIISFLLRRKFLLPELSKRDNGEDLNVIREAAQVIYQNNHNLADNFIQGLLKNGDQTSRNEASEIYSGIFRKYWNDELDTPSDCESLAFERLIWLAVSDASDLTKSEAYHFFSSQSKSLNKIAVKFIDQLLGSSITFGEKLVELEKSPNQNIVRPTSELDHIQLGNKISYLENLRSNFIETALSTSSLPEGLTVAKAVDFYKSLPANDFKFRGLFLEELGKYTVTAKDLNCILPCVYESLMSNEVISRYRAIKALNNMSRKLKGDLPNLILELQMALLTDPYIIIHSAAIELCGKLKFPDFMFPQLEMAILNLILNYSKTGGNDKVLSQAIKYFCNKLLTSERIDGGAGNALISNVIAKMSDMYAVEVIEAIGNRLINCDELPKLICELMMKNWCLSTNNKNLAKLLLRIPPKLLELNKEYIYSCSEFLCKRSVHELEEKVAWLSIANAWDLAVKLCDFCLSELEDNKHNELLILRINLFKSLCEFELNPPTNESQYNLHSSNWQSISSNINQLEEEYAQKRDFPPIFLR